MLRPSRSVGPNPPMTSWHPSSASAAARSTPKQNVHRNFGIGTLAENDLGSESLDAFREDLAKLGWVEGRNLRVDLRFGAGDIDRIRTRADELVRLGPEVIVTNSGGATRALQQATGTIPIVFIGGGDAAANGLVRNIARPEGNTTGFNGILAVRGLARRLR